MKISNVEQAQAWIREREGLRLYREVFEKSTEIRFLSAHQIMNVPPACFVRSYSLEHRQVEEKFLPLAEEQERQFAAMKGLCLDILATKIHILTLRLQELGLEE